MTEQNVYDVFEYPGYSFPNTHPDRLAVMGWLHGVSPAPVENCRVLEIGCGEGANLIPLAATLPQAEFTGFDLAGGPIRRGQERARSLGLSNLRLFQADLLNVGSEQERGGLDQYDYILAHGVYAWVEKPVRDSLLAVCSRHLAPNGIAFLSYNAYPGSHIRNMIRDVLGAVLHGRPQGQEHIAQGLDLLEALMQVRAENDPYRRVFEEQLATMRRRAPNTTLHDELAPGYDPVWFSAFVGHARSHGLEFLSEAQLPLPDDPSSNSELMARVRAVAGDDPIRQQEILDFSRMEMFRETLLVHDGQPVHRQPDPAALRRMRLASSAISMAGERPGQRVYALEAKIKVAIDQAPAIAVMEQLIAAWPRTVRFDDVCTTLRDGGLPPGADPAQLLLQMAAVRILELHTWQPAVANAVSERPRIAGICRQELAHRPYLANLWHGTVQVSDPVVRKLMLLTDGTRTRGELLAALVLEFPSVSAGELEKGVAENLERFRSAALLDA